MAQPVRQIVSGTGVSSPPVVLNLHATPFNVSVTVYVGTSNTYTVEYTLDDPFDNAFDPSTATWISHPDATDATTDSTVQLVTPVTAVRLNQTTGTNVSTFVVIQAGIT